ncbi:MAG TPA: alpha/beta hydrolase [Tepidisphaeraceae bacterium]|jgi:acetyl esterase/lipase|nr:alpha/beta hydrolase [Tepidisphaeraceae bacterium]
MKFSSRIILGFWFAMVISLAGCNRFEMLNATVPSWGYTLTSNIAYGNLPRQKLDVYRPRNAKPNASVVIFFYGGDWQSGEKAGYRFVAEALTSEGFIAVLPDYRIYPDVQFPAFVEDGAQSIRWVHDNIATLGGDSHCIYLMGHSAGAHIAALLTLDARYLKDVGLDRSAIRATAALSGPYDFVPAQYDLPVFGMAQGETPSPNIEPIHFVDGQEPAMLLVQGLRDTTVDPANATHLAAKIRDTGGEVKLITYPDRGHPDVVLSFAGIFRWLAPVLHDTTQFFRECDVEKIHHP